MAARDQLESSLRSTEGSETIKGDQSNGEEYDGAGKIKWSEPIE